MLKFNSCQLKLMSGNNEGHVVGQCLQMCPRQEEVMRIRERLVHDLEKNGKLVKCFKRSAAGTQTADPSVLRPPDVLQSTVAYLLNDIASYSEKPFPFVYDFLDDRLRAVRQDLFIQQCSDLEAISVLEPIVRFYAYSSYKLCEEGVHKFDPVLNHNQLLETLKCLLRHYDRCNYKGSSRIEIECLYHVLSLGEASPIVRQLSLPAQLRRERLLENVLRMSLSWFTGNFYRAIKLSVGLSPLIQALFCSMQLPYMQKYGFEVLNSAYSSKSLGMPVKVVKNWLLFNSDKDVSEYGSVNGLEIISGDEIAIKFSRTSDKTWVKPSPKKKHEVDRMLEQVPLSELLLSTSCDVH